MPRTPLLQAISRLAKDHVIAERRGISVGAVHDLRAELRERTLAAKQAGAAAPTEHDVLRRHGLASGSGLKRRDFLRGAGIAAAAAALSSSNAARAAAGQPSIAIIGGGIAGLSCALDLADHGLSSTVYEASTRIGGRMHSNFAGEYWAQGQTSEWCGELIDTNHATIRSLAKRFNLNVVDVKAASPNGSEDTFYMKGGYYSRDQANTDFQAVHHELSSAIQAAGYPTTFDTSTAAGRVLDNTTLYDWIEQHVPGGHGSAMGTMLDIAYTEELALETSKQSSLNMIYLLGFNATPGNFEIFGISDERFHIAGGNQQLPNAIANYLGVGTTVKTGYRMSAIKKNADGRFTVSFDGKSAVTADYVVCCIPFSILRDLDFKKAGFDALKQKTIKELGAGKSGKLQLQFTQRYWGKSGGPWPGISNGDTYSDTGFQNAWDVTRGQAGTCGIMNDYTGGPVASAMATLLPYAVAGDPGVIPDAQRFLQRLEPVFPGISPFWNGKATSSLPHLDPNLKLSYSHWELGQYQTIAGYEGVRQGNCLFAGEHTSIDFQGFMEGGAFSGQRAAEEILADLK